MVIYETVQHFNVYTAIIVCVIVNELTTLIKERYISKGVYRFTLRNCKICAIDMD